MEPMDSLISCSWRRSRYFSGGNGNRTENSDEKNALIAQGMLIHDDGALRSMRI